MGLAGALGALLLPDSSYGYRLAATLEAELGPTWTVRPSQVYLTLGRMQRDGWLVMERVTQTRRPDRRLLSLTRTGRLHARSWLEAVGDDDLVMRIAVARTVVPDAFANLVARAVAARVGRLHALRSVRDGEAGGFRREAVEAEISRVRGELSWLETIERRATEIVAVPPAMRPSQRLVRVAG